MPIGTLSRSAHTQTDPGVWADLAARAAGGPRFASARDVEDLALKAWSQVGRHSGVDVDGDVRAQLLLSPGVVGLRLGTVRRTSAVEDRAAGRLVHPAVAMAQPMTIDAAQQRRAVQSAMRMLGVAEFEDEGRAARGVVREWSRGSRKRMVWAIGQLDQTLWKESGMLAMVTLTLPDHWQLYAPTGKAFKALFRAFIERWRRAVGDWQGIWKLEFQKRGAPHIHMLTKVPAKVGDERLEFWLSRTWAEVCAAGLPADDRLAEFVSGEYRKHLNAGTGVDFSGVKFSDPRRTALYFLKHSSKTMDSKEYQHVVPVEWQAAGAGPGRFWGIAGLARAAETVELDLHTLVRARRILRGVARGRAAVTAISRLRAANRKGEISDEQLRAAIADLPRRRPRSLTTAGGFVLVNDGVRLGEDLVRALRDPDVFARPNLRDQWCPEMVGWFGAAPWRGVGYGGDEGVASDWQARLGRLRRLRDSGGLCPVPDLLDDLPGAGGADPVTLF